AAQAAAEKAKNDEQFRRKYEQIKKQSDDLDYYIKDFQKQLDKARGILRDNPKMVPSDVRDWQSKAKVAEEYLRKYLDQKKKLWEQLK
ncbi:MAG: hypothetical protein LBT89_04090, partial [Planctomycetaceae bacterium]|nr:hypothetical protein [Planctomycetaceae bacterium]